MIAVEHHGLCFTYQVECYRFKQWWDLATCGYMEAWEPNERFWLELIGFSLSEWKRYGAGPQSPIAYVCVYVYLIKQPILTAKSKLKYFTSSDGPSEAEWRKALTWDTSQPVMSWISCVGALEDWNNLSDSSEETKSLLRLYCNCLASRYESWIGSFPNRKSRQVRFNPNGPWKSSMPHFWICSREFANRSGHCLFKSDRIFVTVE